MTHPIPKSSRSKILDVLRGIALLGVYISNLGAFSGYVFLSSESKEKLVTSTINPFYDFFHYAFIDGKFYSVFSILFGIGFGIFLSKSNGLTTFYKRLIILFVFGIAHSFLLWNGDILLLYATIGFLLPLFSKLSNKVLLWISIILILSPIVLDTCRVATNNKFSPEAIFYMKGEDKIKEHELTINSGDDLVKYFQEEDYSQMKKILEVGFFFRWGDLISSNRIPKVLALFLIGMMIGRNKWYEGLETKRDFLIQWRKIFFIIGFPTTLAFAYINVFATNEIPILDSVLYAFSVIPMALVYISTITLFFLKNGNKLEIFSFVGKMTLTNYVLQSCIAYFLFYGTGLGLFGKIGSVLFPFITILVYGIQVYLSKLWLDKFEFGPLEWIWRQLTYGKYIPIRK